MALKRKLKIDDTDPGFTAKFRDEEEVAEATSKDLEKMYELLYLMYAESRRSLLIILQGIDASGKDGSVRHLFRGANPLGFRAYSFKEPSAEELRHDFLWRCHRVCPERGYAAVFNRSYYEEVTTVRVHPNLLDAELMPQELLKDSGKIFERRYKAINKFEKMLADEGTTVVKFFLHVSKEEQKNRLGERLKDSKKNWKFSPSDLKERKHWNGYMSAFQEMIDATSTEHAPWTVIPADKKWYRNYLISKEVVRVLSELPMKFPKLRR
jgi:PPK2 family polyphosphate:nucleotide phosphotransferase